MADQNDETVWKLSSCKEKGFANNNKKDICVLKM